MGRAFVALTSDSETPARLLVAASAGVLLVYTALVVTSAHANSTFVGDDLIGFWLARTLPLRDFLLTPIDVHFVPLHRLVSWLVYALWPMNFVAGLGVLLAIHLATLGVLYAALKRLAGRPAAAVLVCIYGLHPCVGALFLWWTSGLHRLGCVFCTVCALYSWLRYRDGARWPWLAAFGAGAVCSVGFYSKGALIPLYVLALEASLRATRNARPSPRRLAASLAIALGVAGAYVLAWRAGTADAMHAVNHDVAFLARFVELGLRVLVPSVFGVWLDPRLAVLVASFGGLLAVFAASVWGARGAVVAWVALATVLAANMVVLGASRAKSGLFGFGTLWSDRYYFENAFLIVLFVAVALRPALDRLPSTPLARRRSLRLTGAFAVAVALTGLAFQSFTSFHGIRAAYYPGGERARRYMDNLRAGVAELRAAGVERIPLRDSPVSSDLIGLGELVATNASLLELMNEPVRVSRRAPYTVERDGSVVRRVKRR